MKTQVLKVSSQKPEMRQIKAASDVIKRGGTVVFPTETVYGLGADGLNPSAIKKIFEAKGRPLDNPLILHISETKELFDLIEYLPRDAQTLMECFWPGPMTMVFKKSRIVPYQVTAGLDTVAVRMPNNKIARMLIKLSGRPIAAPSANLSGRPSPTKVEHVIQDLSGKVDVIIDGGDTPVGVESTVIDMTHNPPMVLRPGGVTVEQLSSVLGHVEIDPNLDIKQGRPKSPGLKYKHYSPEAQVVLIEGQQKARVEKIKTLYLEKSQNQKVGIMCVDETYNLYKGWPNVVSMGSEHRPETVASNIFKCLRSFDAKGVDVILVEGIHEKGLGLAVMNRLRKAAGFNIIKV